MRNQRKRRNPGMASYLLTVTLPPILMAGGFGVSSLCINSNEIATLRIHQCPGQSNFQPGVCNSYHGVRKQSIYHHGSHHIRPHRSYRYSTSHGMALMGSKDDQIDLGNTTINIESSKDTSSNAQNSTNASQNTSIAKDSTKWQANNFERDYQLLKIAIAKQSAKSNLQQQQRKYTLDYGFARNRRPLFQDIIQTIVTVGGWMLFLSGCNGVCNLGFHGAIQTWQQSQSWMYKLHILSIQSAITISNIHYWIGCMTLPLVLLLLFKFDKLGPPGRILDEYFTSKAQSSSHAPSFFYTSDIMSKKKAREKDTGNFALCLLENWSSAVVISLVCNMIAYLRKIRLTGGLSSSALQNTMSGMNVGTRLLTRLGAAAAIHQYPSLLFELRRNDQPRPLCRTTTCTQQAVTLLLNWLPLGVAADLAILRTRIQSPLATVRAGSVAASILSVMSPLCHLVALGRIVRISKCSAVSLSKATSFPASLGDTTDPITNQGKKVKWRYKLRWRTPQRIAITLKSWTNYFLTGHVPLLSEMDYWKKQPIRFDDFSTEGTHYLMYKDSKLSDEELKSMNRKNDDDDLIPHADDIIESLSFILRDRDAAILNATQARFNKHQESYDTKALDDVLGVAVQQTFGIGLSYDFDHFDSPDDGEDVSIHQLRARMAKSAVRRKRELDTAMEKELDVLHRLKENVVTATNKDEAEKEMKSVEEGIRERHDSEIDRMRTALLTLIPTHADMPKGAERYDSPIMVAEYVDLNAPVERPGELKATFGSAPDTLSMIEDYVRRDYGDEAADAYRQDEIAAKLKEKEMLSSFRERYGEIDDDEILQSVESSSEAGGSDAATNTDSD